MITIPRRQKAPSQRNPGPSPAFSILLSFSSSDDWLSPSPLLENFPTIICKLGNLARLGLLLACPLRSLGIFDFQLRVRDDRAMWKRGKRQRKAGQDRQAIGLGLKVGAPSSACQIVALFVFTSARLGLTCAPRRPLRAHPGPNILTSATRAGIGIGSP